MTSWTDIMQVDTPVTTGKVNAANTASTAAKDEDSTESIWDMIIDLAHSDNGEVNVALDDLNLDLLKNKKKCYKIQVAGGCHALVLLMEECLAEAIAKFPACDQVTELNELTELTTLHKTLHIMIRLTHHLDESKIGITAIGGVQAVVKAMKTFPSTGKKRIMEADGMEYLLAAINNHLDHADTCERAFSILMILIADSNDNTDLSIDLVGSTTTAKVKKKWPENSRIQTGMCHLSKPIAAYFNR